MSASLVLLRGCEVGDLEREFGDSVKVTQIMSPRLAVVEAAPETLDRLRSEGRVTDPAEARGRIDLTETERLFLEGWQPPDALESMKSRRGEGLDWDAEGFSAP